MRIKGSLRVALDYNCHDCSAIEQGTSFCVDIDCHGIDEAASILQQEEGRTDFPVGWSRSFPDILRCPGCTLKRDIEYEASHD